MPHPIPTFTMSEAEDRWGPIVHQTPAFVVRCKTLPEDGSLKTVVNKKDSDGHEVIPRGYLLGDNCCITKPPTPS